MKSFPVSVWPGVIILLFASCTYTDINKKFDCNKSDLSISLISTRNATSCHSINGQAIVSATGGLPPYDFSLGDGVYTTNPAFENLAPGNYLITVKDVHSCKRAIPVEVNADGSTLTASAAADADTGCQSNNGTVTVTANNGTTPYVMKIDNGTFGSNNVFPNLGDGSHTVIVKDADDCQRVIIVKVPRGNTGVSYINDIAPLFTTHCNLSSCHDAGSGGRDWTKLSNIQANAENIKMRTSNRSMPIGTGPTLTSDQIQLIACWVDDGAQNN